MGEHWKWTGSVQCRFQTSHSTAQKPKCRFSNLLHPAARCLRSAAPALCHRAADRETNQAERGAVKSPGPADRWPSTQQPCSPSGGRTDGSCLRSLSLQETLKLWMTNKLSGVRCTMWRWATVVLTSLFSAGLLWNKHLESLIYSYRTKPMIPAFPVNTLVQFSPDTSGTM